MSPITHAEPVAEAPPSATSPNAGVSHRPQAASATAVASCRLRSGLTAYFRRLGQTEAAS